MTNKVLYECLECPQILPDVKKGERTFTVDRDEVKDPIFCPWCGNRTVIEGGVDWGV